MLRHLCLAAALLLPASLPLSAEPVTVEGRTFELVPPVGYCFLDQSDPNLKALVDSLIASNQGDNLVIGYAGACNEVTAYQVGAVPYLQEYATFMVPLVNDAFQAGSTSRADFLSTIVGSMPAIDDATLQQLEAEVNQRGAQAISGSRFLGLLYRDDDAVYMGLMVTASNEQTSVVSVAVIAVTLIGDVPVSMNIYRPYHGNADIVALLVEATMAMRNLVAANP